MSEDKGCSVSCPVADYIIISLELRIVQLQEENARLRAELTESDIHGLMERIQLDSKENVDDGGYIFGDPTPEMQKMIEQIRSIGGGKTELVDTAQKDVNSLVRKLRDGLIVEEGE